MRSITLIMAMWSEAAPLVEALGLKAQAHPFNEKIPFTLFCGTVGPCTLRLLVSGRDSQYGVDNVATVPATLMTYLAVEHFAPELVLNAGTAGGIGAKGCAIGDVYLSDGHFGFHDRRIPLPGFQEYGRGCYPAYDTREMASALGLKQGAMSTGNSLDMLPADFAEIEANGAIIKDMEVAAVAWVCRTLGVPLVAVKAVTDLIDGPEPTEEQFLANLSMATQRLQEQLCAVLNYLSARSV